MTDMDTKTITTASGARVIVRADEASVADAAERMDAEHREQGHLNVDGIARFTDRRL